MVYSHSDRLEGFRMLYMTLADEQKGLYDTKDQWESLSEDLDDVYFWTALEDMYQNDLLEVDGLKISGSTDLELTNFSIENYEELDKIRIPREWDLDSDNIEVFTDHFKRHDQPEPEDYSLGSSVSQLEISRHVEKGDKSIEYMLENNTDRDEASLRLEVEFKVPDFSPEIRRIFSKYAGNYLNKIERQEVNTLRERATERAGKDKKSTGA